MKFIVTFDDVSGSILAERALKHLSYPCTIDTAPRSLGASCVYIIRAEAQTQQELEGVLNGAEISWAKIIEQAE